MTVTKRLKLKLILLMLSSCSFVQHVPLTVVSPESGVTVNTEEKRETGESALAARGPSGFMVRIGTPMAQASGGSVVVTDDADDDAESASEAATESWHLPESTRYWEHGQRSTAM